MEVCVCKSVKPTHWGPGLPSGRVPSRARLTQQAAGRAHLGVNVAPRCAHAPAATLQHVVRVIQISLLNLYRLRCMLFVFHH